MHNAQAHQRYHLDLIPARVDGSDLGDDGLWRHGWVEQFPQTDGTYTDAVGGRWGTTDQSWFFELNNARLADNSFVWLRMRCAVGGIMVYDTIGAANTVIDFSWPGGTVNINQNTTVNVASGKTFTVAGPGTVKNSSTLTLVYDGTTVDITDDSTWTLSGSKTWTLTGGASSVVALNFPTVNVGNSAIWTFDSTTQIAVNGYLDLCGWWSWCYDDTTLASITTSPQNPLDPSAIKKPVVGVPINATITIRGVKRPGDAAVWTLRNRGSGTATINHLDGASISARDRVATPTDLPIVWPPGTTLVFKDYPSLGYSEVIGGTALAGQLPPGVSAYIPEVTAPGTPASGYGAVYAKTDHKLYFKGSTGTEYALTIDMAAGVATFLATPSSANLIAAVTDETGTGSLVFATDPALAGTPTAPTAAPGTNTTQIATTAFVVAAGGSVGTNIPAWVKVTKTYADLSAAATTNTITLLTLTAKQVVEQAVLKHSTAFTGGAIASYNLEVGYPPAHFALVPSFDVKQTVTDFAYSAPTNAQLVLTWSGTVAVTLTATSSGANLSATSQGSVDVWLKLSTLP